MADDALTTTSWVPETGRAHLGEEVLTLVVLWSIAEPERMGESAVLARGEGPWTLGRNGSLPWGRRRPRHVHPTGALGDRRLSRTQLEVAWHGRQLHVVNEGRLPLYLNGRPVEQCTVGDGDLLALGDRLLLVVRSRPTLWAEVEVGHPWGDADDDGIVGESPACHALRERIGFLGRRNAHVLVLGPSGAGKELVARGLHRHSRRRRRALVSRNASTIPESLADAELFGNIAGYPNHGMPGRPGLVGEADGSTLFLDEFGELPLDVQARLLRVLDDGEYSRLGDAAPRHADLRLVAATNRSATSLKHDVLARFPLRVQVPPLDARREDVPLIAAHLLRGIAAGDPEVARRCFPDGDVRRPPQLTVALVQSLVARSYSTHVRELASLLWQSLTESHDGWLRPPAMAAPPAAPATGPRVVTGAVDPNELDPEMLQRVLDRHGGRQEPAWRELGLSSRHVLARLVKKHGLVVRGRGGR